MKRRLFLQLPLVASALVSEAKGFSKDRPNKGFKVEANKDRYQEELLIMGGSFSCKVSSKDTDGDLLIYDTVRHEKGGPAFHVHHRQDEWFYVIKGAFLVKVADETFTLSPGDWHSPPEPFRMLLQKPAKAKGKCWCFFNRRA